MQGQALCSVPPASPWPWPAGLNITPSPLRKQGPRQTSARFCLHPSWPGFTRSAPGEPAEGAQLSLAPPPLQTWRAASGMHLIFCSDFVVAGAGLGWGGQVTCDTGMSLRSVNGPALGSGRRAYWAGPGMAPLSVPPQVWDDLLRISSRPCQVTLEGASRGSVGGQAGGHSHLRAHRGPGLALLSGAAQQSTLYAAVSALQSLPHHPRIAPQLSLPSPCHCPLPHTQLMALLKLSGNPADCPVSWRPPLAKGWGLCGDWGGLACSAVIGRR